MTDQRNRDYRATDGTAYQDNPLVLGYEIKLSAILKPNTRCGLCCTLAGEYPTWFKWLGWHTECLCFKIPILMSDAMMAKYQKLVARGEDTPEAIKELQKGSRIDNLPQRFVDWCQNTFQTQQCFDSAPAFIKTNFETFKQMQKLTYSNT